MCKISFVFCDMVCLDYVIDFCIYGIAILMKVINSSSSFSPCIDQ